jgi:hypothetical protein
MALLELFGFAPTADAAILRSGGIFASVVAFHVDKRVSLSASVYYVQ